MVYSPTKKVIKKNIRVLAEALINFYPENHTTIIYEAAQYPGMKPSIHKGSLKFLKDYLLSDFCTLYVPPIAKAPIDFNRAVQLNINL